MGVRRTLKIHFPSQGFILWFIYFSIMLNFYTYTYVQLLGQILILGYILILIEKKGIKKRTLKISVKYFVWYGGFVIWAFLSRKWAVYPERTSESTLLTILRICVMGGCIIYYMSLTNCVDTVVDALIYAGAFFCLITIFSNSLSVWGKEEFVSFGKGFMRNGIASICLMLICFTIFWGEQIEKYDKNIMLGIFSLTLFLCGSRRSILMLMCFMLLYNLTEKSQTLKLKRFCILGIIGIASYAVLRNIPYVYNTYIVRIEQMFMGTTSSDTSTTGRLAYINFGWKMFLERPILGWGTDAFYTALFRGNVRIGNAVLHAVYSHNNYIEILTSYGLVGAVLFYRFHLQAFLYNIKDRENNQIARFLFITMIIWLISDYGGIVFSVHIHMYFLIISFFLFCNKKYSNN